jgi:hypothetical protein
MTQTMKVTDVRYVKDLYPRLRPQDQAFERWLKWFDAVPLDELPPLDAMSDAARLVREFLARPLPDGAVEDLRDLGVIGYANDLPGATPPLMHRLIGQARANGRSWDEIGRRLDLTAAEAEAAYRELGAGWADGRR